MFETIKEGTKQAVHIDLRFMIRHDMPEVLAIENASFEFPWSNEDFVYYLRQTSCIGMVAEHSSKVVGFMIYNLCKNNIGLLNFAVLPEMRRRGIGEKMITKLQRKLSEQRRAKIIFNLREKNLPAQLFFRQCGFRAIDVLRNLYEDTHEDAYLMEYHIPNSSYTPKNRISELRG